jgi:hypothetical protein
MHPVQYHVETADDRNRLTAFFRLILVIPHAILASLWLGVAYIVALISWLAILITGSNPQGLWSFVAGAVKYWGRVSGYAALLVDPFPPFNGTDAYPIMVRIERPERQSRLTTLFRGLLVIPAAVFGYLLGAAGSLVALVQWVAIIVTGRCPTSLEDFQALVQNFGARTSAYALLLVDRYPSFEAPDVEAAPDDASAPGQLPPAV